jgi:hypothetical protein
MAGHSTYFSSEVDVNDKVERFSKELQSLGFWIQDG